MPPTSSPGSFIPISAAAVMVGTYDFRLVALSVFISMLGAYAAVELAERVTAARGRAWLLWVIILLVIGGFLNSVQHAIIAGSNVIPGFNVTLDQYTNWHDTYNQALTNSLFAQVNGFILSKLPVLKSSGL